MSHEIKDVARFLIGLRKYEGLERNELLAGRCQNCMHYRFICEPSEIYERDCQLHPMGHVCDYSENLPVRDLVDKERKFKYDFEKSRDDFEISVGVRSLKDRLDLRDCEFQEFPEPRTKPWGEKDENWDGKYKDEFTKLLTAELKRQGSTCYEIMKTIAQEFGD